MRPHRQRPYLCAILLLIILLTGQPQASRAAAPNQVPLPTTTLLGIAAHAWWFDPYMSQYLAAFADLNVQVVRIGIDWKRVEAVKGAYDWSLYDHTLIPLAERRITIVADLNSFPAWTSTDPYCGNRSNEVEHCLPRADAIDDWARFVAAAAARYPFIERWEVWNEPELWVGMRRTEQYLAYLGRAHAAIRAAIPTARVAVSSLLGWDWVGELYRLSSPDNRPWEAVAYHPYPVPDGINDQNRDVPIDFGRIERLRQGMIAYGHGALPIWITEFGFSKPPEEQAYRLNKALSFFAGRTDIELVCLHTLHDWAEDAPSPNGYGLMTADPRPIEEQPTPTTLIPKEPFYSAYKNYPRVAPPPPADGPALRYFAATGETLGAPFLAAWERGGGLAIFGFPLTEIFWERLEDGHWYRVQYFERARFEYHPENAPPNDVLLGQFGRYLHPADPPAPPVPGARYFAETGHNLEGHFRDYWEAHGGLTIFGLPISEVFVETLDDGKPYVVQYFERARFEFHPEAADPQYQVLLGQFGRRILAGRGGK